MRVVDRDRRRESMGSGENLDDRGFIMVALLIGIAVSAIWMAALLPSWAQQETRERELEMIFRGEQYARAIYLYRLRNQAPPPNIDTLVNQKFLRRKYLDPITGKDFLPVGGVSAVPGAGRAGTATPQLQGGITGVRSESNETSIVIYANQQVHSQFPFDWTQEMQRSGAVVPQLGGPNQRGGASGARGTDGRGSSQPFTPGGTRGGQGGIDAGLPGQGLRQGGGPGTGMPRGAGPTQPAPGPVAPGGGRR